MLTENDPMRGYYDRALEKGGENLEIIKGIFWMILRDFNWDAEKFISDCAKRGYGTEATMRKIIYGEKES